MVDKRVLDYYLRRIIISILLVLPISCSKQERLAAKVIEECTNSNIDFGCIVVSVNKEEFIIIDNDILKDRVYYDIYYDSFDDYSDFLFTVLNKPGEIDYSLVLNPNNYFANSRYKFIASLPRSLFSSFFLRKTNRDIYTPKHYSSRTLPFILRKCYDLGYYVYRPGYSGEWMIGQTPIERPPVLREGGPDNDL